MANWYVNSVAAAAVAQWAAGHVYATGSIVTQLAAPGVSGFRCFRTAAGGTSGGSEPRWNLTPGGTTVADNTITDWVECTGVEARQAPGAWAAPFDRLQGPTCIYATVALISAAGAGYAVGDLIQVTGGTPVSGCGPILKVKTVSAGAILTFETMATVGTSGGAFVADPGAGALATTALTGTGNNAATVTLSRAAISLAGDNINVSSNNADTQAAALTIVSPGSPASPQFIYCVDETASGHIPPTSADLRTTATVSTTGANAMTVTGSFYCYGIIFQIGSGAVAAALNLGSSINYWQRYDSCKFVQVATNANNISLVSATTIGAVVEWINTTVQFGNTGGGFRPSGVPLFRWINTPSAIAGATLPTNLFNNSTVNAYIAILEGVDLSALGSGKTLFATGTNGGMTAYLKDCQLGASVTVAATPTTAQQKIYVIRSDSAATNYRSEKYDFAGTETTETTIIRTGGASDGTTPQSRKIVTTANAKWVLHFEALPIAVWNNTVGSPVTMTMHAVSGAAGLLNNDDVWITAEYLGSALTPLGSRTSSTKADNLAAGTAYTASGATWAGSPAGTPFTMSVTFTPQQKGTIYIYPRVGKATATVYIDPIAILS